MTSNTRAVAALRQIMLDDSETMPIRRRIEAAEQLLDFEAPVDIVEEAKAFLTSVAEAEETLVDFRLDALKLLRKVEARKVVPPKAAVRDDPRRIEMRRKLEILKRRAALVEAGVFPFPEGYDDDLTGPDYVPMPTDDDAEREQDLAEALRKARVAHMRKIGAKSS
jgi:hypothetical protein